MKLARKRQNTLNPKRAVLIVDPGEPENPCPGSSRIIIMIEPRSPRAAVGAEVFQED